MGTKKTGTGTTRKTATKTRSATNKPATAKKTAANKTTAPKVTRRAAKTAEPATTQGEIETAAYYLAEKRGFAPGHELEDWLTAERQLAEQHAH